MGFTAPGGVELPARRARQRASAPPGPRCTSVYEKEISELLGIPPRVRQGVLLPTAYYNGETFRPAHREPLETVLHVDHW